MGMIRLPLLFLSTGLAALAQTPTAKPEFEAAEVKLNKSGELRMNASLLFLK